MMRMDEERHCSCCARLRKELEQLKQVCLPLYRDLSRLNPPPDNEPTTTLCIREG